MPRNRADFTGNTMLWPSPVGLAKCSALDHYTRPLLKWISSLLDTLNAIPRVLAHYKHISQASSNCLAFDSGFLPKAIRLVSSAKPTRPMYGCFSFIAWYRLAI